MRPNPDPRERRDGTTGGGGALAGVGHGLTVTRVTARCGVRVQGRRGSPVGSPSGGCWRAVGKAFRWGWALLLSRHETPIWF